MKSFHDCCCDWAAAKLALVQAAEVLLAAESALIPFAAKKDEGTASFKDENFKVEVEYRINRTVDAAALDALRKEDEIKWAVERMFVWKPEVSVKELKYFRDNEPELYARLAAPVTAKPGKPGVKVTVLRDAAVDVQEAA